MAQPTAPHAPADPAREGLHAFWTVLLCSIWAFTGLLGREPWRSEDAIGFGLVWSMMQTGDWLVPALAGDAVPERAPLFYATAAAFGHLLGALLPAHDGTRFALALFVALALAAVAIAARELYGREHTWVAPLVLVGCVGLLVDAHIMISEVAQFAGVALAVCGLAVALRRPVTGGLVLGTGAGVALCSQGLLLPALLGATALLLPVAFPAWRSRAHGATLVAAALALVPWALIWPVALWARSPELFSAWLAHQDPWAAYAAGPAGLAAYALEYLSEISWYAWPAWPLALYVLWQRGRAIGGDRALQLPLGLAAVMLPVLAIAAGGRQVYVMPLLVPLALLATVSIDSLRRGAASFLDWFGIMTFGLLAAAIWIAWIALATGWPTAVAQPLDALHPGAPAAFAWWKLAVGLGATLIWIALVWRIGRSNRRAIINWAAGITLVWILVNAFLLSFIDHGKSYRGMYESMQRALPSRFECLQSTALGESQRVLLHYYTAITPRALERDPEAYCELYLVQGRIAEQHDPGPPWRLIWEGARPGERTEWFRLYQRLPG